MLPAIFDSEPRAARAIAADCIASPALHRALADAGADPLSSAGVLRLALSRTDCPRDQGRRSRAALVRASMLLRSGEGAYPRDCHSIVDRELVEWARRFDEHRDPSVLRAVLAATRRCGPRLHAWLSGGDGDEHLPLRSAAAKVDLETAAGLAICWLAWPALVPAARRVFDRVVERADADLVEELLGPWVLLRSRERSARAASVLRSRGLDTLMAVPGLSAHTRMGLIEVAGLLGTSGAASLVGSGVVADPDERVRYRAVRMLAQAPASDCVDEGLQDFGYDRDPLVGSAAVGAVSRVQSRHRRVASAARLRGLTRCAEGGVRRLAERTIERFDPQAFPAGAEARWACPASARWMHSRSPDTFLDGLRERLARPDTTDPALALVRRLKLVGPLTAQIIAVSHGADNERTRASAALMLGSAARDDGDESARERAFTALAELLGDRDPRVRANALEALSMLRGGSIRLDRYTQDQTPRIRANAIRHASLCETAHGGSHEHGAVRLLGAMLADDRPEHRISALWVASRTRPAELAGSVARTAREDPDGQVRARARRCAMKLLSLMEPAAREVAVG